MRFNTCHIFRLFVIVPALVLIGVLSSSCRSLVLEDRSLCPTWVELKSVPSLDPARWNYMKLSLLKDWEEDGEQVVRTDDLNAGQQIEWRKEHMFEVAGITGWSGIIEGNGEYLIPFGDECPEAMGGYVRQQLGGEEIYHVDMPVRSLYANVFVEIEGAASGYPFRVVLRGAVDGYTFPYLHLHEGPFECEPRELSYEMRACRIPRQDEPSNASKAVYVAGLKADFLFKEEGKSEWEKFYSLPLGEIVTMNGYDWSKPMLDDIHVKIHLADGSITRLVVEVADWKVVVIGHDERFVI